MINKHKSNKIKENSNTVRHLNNGTDHRHSKSCCDQSSPARRTMRRYHQVLLLEFISLWAIQSTSGDSISGNACKESIISNYSDQYLEILFCWRYHQSDRTVSAVHCFKSTLLPRQAWQPHDASTHQVHILLHSSQDKWVGWEPTAQYIA